MPAPRTQTPKKPVVRPSSPPDILTYRYNGNMVYVTPGATHAEGVKFAQQVFPELAAVEPARIAISVNGLVNGQRQLVRISPMAWPTVVFSRARYEVLDVTVDSDVRIDIIVTDADGLPLYSGLKPQTPGVDPDAKAQPDATPVDFTLDPSRAPYPVTSAPPSPARLPHKENPVPYALQRRRPASPSSISTADSSSSVSDWARSLFGKNVH
ncbi:hypothetical protein BD413DRAFT_487045 [Trametes elegans]|nr:hypothetical protein BD413DRAFT_487045 [Trametes elegans]